MSISTTTSMKAVILAAAAAAALTVAGCSDNTSDTSTSPTTASSTGMSGSMPGMDHGGSSASAASPSGTRSDFNDADVMFLQMMYPHHAQAIDMAKLVPSRSQNQQVIKLAQNIEKAQGPEMIQMTGLLNSFGKPAPTADSGHMDEMPMPGMMTAEQMTTLTKLSGVAFDRMWLQMMIDHHTGAITMSNTELSDGTNADAKKMAEAIIANQQTEISQMQGLLAKI
jgi:uncharacterized protein (DUF305 family)